LAIVNKDWTMSLTKYTTEMARVSKFLKEARLLIGDTVTAQKLDTLLQVALNPDGIPQGDVMTKASLERSAVSKNIADLSKLTQKKEKGPDLIESVIDPMVRTTRTIRVTPSGERKILKALEASFGKKA
jgi:DNA-binding MarR family transcriptional regulator